MQVCNFSFYREVFYPDESHRGMLRSHQETLGRCQQLNPPSSLGLVFPWTAVSRGCSLPHSAVPCLTSPFSSLLPSCIFQQQTMAVLRTWLNLALLLKNSRLLILTLYLEIRELQSVRLDGTSDWWVKLSYEDSSSLLTWYVKLICKDNGNQRTARQEKGHSQV